MKQRVSVMCDVLCLDINYNSSKARSVLIEEKLYFLKQTTFAYDLGDFFSVGLQNIWHLSSGWNPL